MTKRPWALGTLAAVLLAATAVAGGVITGRITDQWGAAMENLQVSVTRLFRTHLPLSVGRTGGSPTDQTYSYSRVSAFTSIRKALRVS